MDSATPSDVRRAFRKMVYESTKSLSLKRECKKLFDAKEMPDITGKLELT